MAPHPESIAVPVGMLSGTGKAIGLTVSSKVKGDARIKTAMSLGLTPL